MEDDDVTHGDLVSSGYIHRNGPVNKDSRSGGC